MREYTKSIFTILFVLNGTVLLGQNIDSLEYIVQNILKEKPSSLPKEKVQSIIELSDLYIKEDSKKAINLIQKGLHYSSVLEDSGVMEMDAIAIYSEALSYTNELDSSIIILKEGIKKFELDSDDKIYLSKLGMLYQNLGLVHRDEGDFVEAAKSFNSAAVYFEKSEDSKNQMSSKYNQANLLARLGSLEEAENAFFELIEMTDDPVTHGVAYTSLGITASKQKKYQEAIKYLNKSKELEKDSKQPELIYMNLGIVYRKLEEFRLAKKHLFKAENLCIEKNRKRTLLLVYNNLSRVLYANNDFTEAKKYLELSKSMVSPKNRTELAAIYEMSSNIHEKQGNWKQALEDDKQKNIYRDSIETKENFAAITEIQTKFETEKKEAENKILKTEKALQASTIQKQRFTLFGTIVGLLLLGVISFLLYRQSGERKKNNTLLKDKNEKIESLHQELSHRVKNNLSFISTLLQLQGRGLENTEAKQAIKEGETRVEAMSILHRKLYIDTENTTFSLGEYLSEICLNLQQTYPYTGNLPTIDHKFEDVQIGVESASRVGLIINELITNSFKYAFLNEPTPQIDIQVIGTNDGFQLTYQDNGIGLPDNIKTEKQQTLGLKLIHTLTKQLNGTLQIDNRVGAFFQFNFKTQ